MEMLKTCRKYRETDQDIEMGKLTTISFITSRIGPTLRDAGPEKSLSDASDSGAYPVNMLDIMPAKTTMYRNLFCNPFPSQKIVRGAHAAWVLSLTNNQLRKKDAFL